jgi:hypothetical protein
LQLLNYDLVILSTSQKVLSAKWFSIKRFGATKDQFGSRGQSLSLIFEIDLKAAQFNSISFPKKKRKMKKTIEKIYLFRL